MLGWLYVWGVLGICREVIRNRDVQDISYIHRKCSKNKSKCKFILNYCLTYFLNETDSGMVHHINKKVYTSSIRVFWQLICFCFLFLHSYICLILVKVHLTFKFAVYISVTFNFLYFKNENSLVDGGTFL